MSIKIPGDFPVLSVTVDNVKYDPFMFHSEEFEPHLLVRKVANHPRGGECIGLVWNYKQAHTVLSECPQILGPLLCINEKTMTIQYCQNLYEVKEFYEKSSDQTP